MIIRELQTTDAEQILEIYAPFVLNSAVSFEENVPDLEDFRSRLMGIAEFYPFWIAEQDGEILGYAYGTRHRERAAYRWIVETSIYFSEKARGNGLGTALYNHLLADLKSKNFLLAYGIITLPNPSSVRLHEKCGFEHMVIHQNAGFKANQWQNVLWMKKSLNLPLAPPPEPIWAH